MKPSDVIERLRANSSCHSNNHDTANPTTTASTTAVSCSSSNKNNNNNKTLQLVYKIPPQDFDEHFQQLLELLPVCDTITRVLLDGRFVHAFMRNKDHFNRLLLDGIGCMPALEQLELRSVGGSVPLQPLCRAVQKLTSLRELGLSFVGLCDFQNCEQLLQQHPSLSKVYVSEFRVLDSREDETDNENARDDHGDDDDESPKIDNLDSFLVGLSTCPALRTIELLSCRSTDGRDPWSPFALACLVSRSPSLQALTLRRLHLSTAHMTALSAALALQHPNQHKLRVLDLSESHIGDHAAMMLAQSVATHTQLRSLNLRDNDITATGCRGIAEALMHNTTTITTHGDDASVDGMDRTPTTGTPTIRHGVLEKLNLASNNIGTAGARALAECVLTGQEHASLQHLELALAKIPDEGCMALANALPQNTTLKGLGLAYNKMTTASYLAFAQALQTNQTLETLHLQANRRHIGLDGCQALLDMLKENYVLETLSTLFAGASNPEQKRYKKAMDTYLRLNSAGRKHLLLDKKTTKLDWVQALFKCQDDFAALLYLLKAQPSLFELQK